MKKKDSFEEDEQKGIPITLVDCEKYRAAIKALSQRNVGNANITKFDQYAESIGAARIFADGSVAVKDPELFTFLSRVRDAVEEFDARKAEEIRELFPHEAEAHRKKLATFSADVKKLIKHI